MHSYKKTLVRAREQHQLVSVLFELTYKCNLDCVVCYNDRGISGVPLSLARYKDLLQELAEMSVMYVVLSGGEPTMHPYFFEVGANAKALGFVVRIKSNGHSLTREKIRRIKAEIDPLRVDVSLHGATAATHDRQTRVPGSFDMLIRNLGYAREAGLRIRINTLLTSLNQDEADNIQNLAEQFGYPVSFTDEITARDNGDKSPLTLNVTIPLTSLFSSLPTNPTNETATTSTTQEQDNSAHRAYLCGTGTSTLVVDPIGNILPCVEWRKPLGNYHRTTIRKIWEGSQQIREVRTLASSSKKLLIEANQKDPTVSLCIAKHLRSGTLPS